MQGGGVPDFAKKNGGTLVNYVKAYFNHPQKPAPAGLAQELWDTAKREGVYVRFDMGHSGMNSSRYAFPHINIGGKHGKYHVAVPMGWRPR